MQASNFKTIFFSGARSGAPFVLVVIPFALLFGVVAAEAGLNVFETLSFSLAVVAGAAQFTALQLMQEQAPTIIVLISALAVNLRMAMYSAALTPHLGELSTGKRVLAAYLTIDQSFACSIAAWEQHPEWKTAEKFAFFIGVCAPLMPFWVAASAAGGLIGQAIPQEFALDFAVPITFLALATPMLRTPAHVTAAFVAIALALAFAWLPYNLGLLVAGTCGMMAGAYVELHVERQVLAGSGS